MNEYLFYIWKCKLWKVNKRYQNRHIILSQIMDTIFNGQQMTKYSVSSMREITDSFRESVNAILNMGYSLSDELSMILYHLLERKVDPITLAHFENKITAVREPRKYNDLMDYLENRILIQSAKERDDKMPQQNQKKKYTEYKRENSSTKNQATSFVAATSSSLPENENKKICECNDPKPTHCGT